MKSDDLERKLKGEQVEVCLNCQRFTDCENIGKFVLAKLANPKPKSECELMEDTKVLTTII